MILSEKITELRKRQGLSQEEFGAEIGVSRQAVSKWEMAQTTPDLNKILAMSELFGVPTDFLLKDEYDLSFLENDHPNNTADYNENASNASGTISNDSGTFSKDNMIELQEVQEYLDTKKKNAKSFVLAIFLFFISPFPGIILSLFSEKLAVLGAIIQIIVLIIMAVILILSFQKLTPYKHLSKENAELGFGVRGAVEESRKTFDRTFLLGIIIGVVSLLAAVIPMMTVSVFNSESNLVIIISAMIMLLIFAFGISCIVYVVTINQGYKRILKMK